LATDNSAIDNWAKCQVGDKTTRRRQLGDGQLGEMPREKYGKRYRKISIFIEKYATKNMQVIDLATPN
jgi:hypothetical protein